MIETFRSLLHLPFMPHGMCYLWQPWVIWLHVIFDSIIALAYLVIPAALIYFVWHRRDLPFHSMFVWFGLFIVACGATHAIEVWNIWHGDYLVAGGIKAITAFASAPTAFFLVRLIPKALVLPSPAQLRKVNEELEATNQRLVDVSEAREKAREEVEHLSQALLRVQEEERRTVAREVHDGIGQHLGGLSLWLATLRSRIDEADAQSNHIVDQCADIVHQAGREVRTISYLLRPPMIEELGLLPSLDWLVEGYAKRSGINVSLEVPAQLRRLPSSVELTLFRVAQESLLNVYRHSGSQVAIIRVICDAGRVTLEIEDKGKGFESRQPGNTDGVGIPAMRERVIQLNGTFNIESFPNNGVTIRAILPISESSAWNLKSASR